MWSRALPGAPWRRYALSKLSRSGVRDLLPKIYRENDPAITARRYQLLTGVYADYPYVLASSIQSVLDVLREDGKIKDTPPAQTFMDTSFLQAVEKERQASGQK